MNNGDPEHMEFKLKEFNFMPYVEIISLSAENEEVYEILPEGSYDKIVFQKPIAINLSAL